MDDNFIKAWMEGKVSPDELTKRKLQGDENIDQLEEIIRRSSQLKVPENLTKQMAWDTLSNRIMEQQGNPEAKVIKWNRWVPVGIAASLTLIAVSYFLFFARVRI